jgi:hypothetical protein
MAIYLDCIKKASLPLADLGLGHLFRDDYATNSNAFSFGYCGEATSYTAEYRIFTIVVKYFFEAKLFHADCCAAKITCEFLGNKKPHPLYP